MTRFARRRAARLGLLVAMAAIPTVPAARAADAPTSRIAPAGATTVPATRAATAAADAARLYADAHRLVKQLDLEDQKLLWKADDGDVRPGPETAGLLERGEAAMAIFHAAARLPACDGSAELGPLDLSAPQMHQVMDLGRLAITRARVRADARDYAGAYADLAAMLAAAGHVAQVPRSLARVYQFLLTYRATTEAARHLPSAPPEVVHAFSARLNALPPTAPMSQAVRADADVLRRMHERMRNDPKLWAQVKAGREAFEELMNDPTGEAAAAAEAGGVTKPAARKPREPDPQDDLTAHPEKWDAALADHARLTSRLADVIDLPPARYEPEWAELTASFEAAHPLASHDVRVIEQFRRQAVEAEVRIAMLLAACADRLGAPGGHKAMTDPAGNGPFARTDLPGGGYQLASELRNSDGPLTLRVGP